MTAACAVVLALIAQQTASVSGRVVDDRGTPLAAASVVVSGGPAPGVHAAITTDDGSFAIAGLAPDVYTITTAKAGFPTAEYRQPTPTSRGMPIELAAGQSVELQVRLPRGAAISGRVLDEGGNPAPPGRIAVLQSTLTGWRLILSVHKTTTPSGDFRIFGLAAGTYRVVALPAGASNEAASSADGVSVTVSAGDEREGVILTASGPVKTTSVTLVPIGAPPEQLRYPHTELRRPGEERASPSYGRRNPDGSFVFDGVPAGSYKAVVIASPLWGAADITVDGEHLTTISVPMAMGRRVQGRVAYDGVAPPLARLTLHMIAADLDGIVTGEFGSIAQVTGDGTFALPGVPPGRFLIRIVGDAPDATWRLASVTHGDRDITDAPLTIGDADVTGVVVTLTDRKTVVRGNARFEGGAPASERFLVFYPQEPALRTRNSRRVDIAITSMSGDYELKGLPPGRYAVAVVDEIDRETLRKPEAVNALTPLAFTTLTLGETTTLSIVVR